MENKRETEYAGNLDKELEEINKLIDNVENMEQAITATYGCGSFYSLVCC